MEPSNLSVIAHKVEFDDSNPDLVVVGIGDVHLGNINTNEEKLKRDVKTIADNPRWRVLLTGDLIEGIAQNDSTFRSYYHKDWVADSVDAIQTEENRLVEILNPIAPQIIASVGGNHDENPKNDRDSHTTILSKLGIPHVNLGVMGYVRIQYGTRFTNGALGNNGYYDIFLHHGAGRGRRTFKSYVQTVRQVHSNADMYLFGHAHLPDIEWGTRVKVSQRQRAYLLRWHAIVGRSYKDTHGDDSYATTMGYEESITGCIAFAFSPKRYAGGVQTYVTSHSELSEIEVVLNARVKDNP